MFAPLLDWYAHALQTGGYPLIALMMFMESTILPLPSELIIPPAAHLASVNGTMSVAGIVAVGTFGSWLGAALMYWASRIVGRPLLMRFGRLVFISPQKIEGAERWAAHYGAMGIFISRMLPVVRHLIGIPAGIVRMDFKLFSLFTLLGAGIWCSILAWLGIQMGQDEHVMNGEYHRIVIWVAGVVLVLAAIYYFFVHRHMKTGAAPRA